jgi:predicted nuclease of restriction endonuclease-like (RecB) superfamily
MKKIITNPDNQITTQDYVTVLQDIQKYIQHAQIEAFTAINVALNMRNWTIGKIIAEKQKQHAWGSDFIEKLAQDLQNMYPGNQGFSAANIYRMKAFHLTYQNIRTAVREIQTLPIFTIPWSHNIIIIQKIKNPEEALWYAQESKENGWSRSFLEDQIKKDLYNRQGKIVSNFHETLEHPHAAITQQAFKDPYIFDFLTLENNHVERDVELGLIGNIEKTLLELGQGFALVGRQYHLEVDDQDYYIDLLFYNLNLRCYVVVELKARTFKPEDVGQVNFYLSAIDDRLKKSHDNPTIALILCKTKKNVTAQYALRGVNTPIGVAEYATEIMKKLEKEFESKLPTITEIEQELEKMILLEETRNIKN